MGFNHLLEAVGGMGRFQVAYITLLLVPISLVACHIFLQNFTAPVVGHHCLLLHPPNQTRWDNLTSQDLLRASIPTGRNQEPERCLRFTSPQWRLLTANATGANVTDVGLEPCLGGWTYDRRIFYSTIISEWDLVCDRQSLRQLAQSVLMAGVLVGGVVFGRLADRFGRRALLIWSYLQMGVAGTCVAFLPSFSSYCAFRFLGGMAYSGVQLNTLSLILEWMPPKGRTFAVSLPGLNFSLGQLVLAGVAYGIRDWRWLQFAVSAPFFLFFLYSWFLPESARWLILNDRSPQAVKNLRKVAWLNGRKDEVEKLTVEVVKAQMKEASTVTSSNSILDLVRTPAMRRISCCLMFVWFSTSFGFYALAMDVQSFGISIFLVQVLFGAADLVAKQVSIMAMDCFGRRLTLAVSLVLAGLLIIANIFVPQEMKTLQTALATLGKGFFAAAFTVIVLYSSELYPTVLRQTGLGFLSMMARVGAMVAPVVHMIGIYVSFLPAAIFAAAALTAGMAACSLMETRNTALLDTVEEVERRARKNPVQEEQVEEVEEKEEVPLTRTGSIFSRAI